MITWIRIGLYLFYYTLIVIVTVVVNFEAAITSALAIVLGDRIADNYKNKKEK